MAIPFGQIIQTHLFVSSYTPVRARSSSCIPLCYASYSPCARKQWRGNRRMDWKTLLAYITGSVDQALLLRNQITGRVRLTDSERTTLADIGQKLGKQTLQEVANIVKPDT